MTWHEIPSTIDELQETLDAYSPFESFHFFHEPWHPDGIVVRLLDGTGVPDEYLWDVGPDEALFGDDWPTVYRLFECGSRLALAHPDEKTPWLHRKMVHCLLNSWGYGLLDETRFGTVFLRGRIRIILHVLSWKIAPLGRGNCIYGCHRAEW